MCERVQDGNMSECVCLCMTTCFPVYLCVISVAQTAESGEGHGVDSQGMHALIKDSFTSE